MLQSAEHANTVIHMHDVIARSQLRHAFQCDCAAETACAPESSCAAEDLVVGENTNWRIRTFEYKARVHSAERERRTRRHARLCADQLFKAFELTCIVAQDVCLF